jgi:hypothetical protein
LKRLGTGIGISMYHIDAYDDFLIQLDDALVERVGDPWSNSVGVQNAWKADTTDGAAFFHCNTPARLRFEKYLNVLRARSQQDGCIDILENKKESLWKAQGLDCIAPSGMA